MLNLISNLLNLFVALSPAPEAQAEPPLLIYTRETAHYSVSLGEKQIFRDDAYYQHLPVLVREGIVGDERYLLLENAHGDGCPAEYVLITAHPDGTHRHFKLGNCEPVGLTAQDHRLELRFEGFFHPDLHPPRLPEAWVYEDGELRELPR